MRLYILFACLLIVSPLVRAVEISADDFLLPVAVDDPAEKQAVRAIKEPEAVARVEVHGQEAVRANTAQDAINAVVDQQVPGCSMVKFGSGFGWVAVGQGSYQKLANPTATRISKRNAYLKAYMQAKAELAKTLGGLSSAAREEVRSALTMVSDETTDAVNLEESTAESLAQATRMLLRGFVIYEVEDDPEAQCIYVSVVTTPKTRAEINRPTPSLVEATEMRDALNQVIHEVTTGVVPPVGTRMLRVRGTDSVAFVGFGSSVIRHNARANLQAKLKVSAQQAATMRAQNALLSVITGDTDSWRGRLDEETRTTLQEFDASTAHDPEGVERMDRAHERFLNVFKQTEAYTSARADQLPPGVKKRSWVSDDGGTAYAMAVYIPAIEVVPDGTLQPADQKPGAGQSEVGQGPTGTVTLDDDLAGGTGQTAGAGDGSAPAWAVRFERQPGWLYGLGRAAGKNARQQSLAKAYLEIAQQLTVTVAGETGVDSETTTVSTEDADAVLIKERIFESIRTSTDETYLIGAEIEKQEERQGVTYTLVALNQAVYLEDVTAQIAQIDKGLARLETDPEVVDAPYLRRVTRVLPGLQRRRGLALILRGQGRKPPPLPLDLAELHEHIGRLAGGTTMILEGHAEAPTVRDATLDVLDGIGLTVLQDEAAAAFELRLREKHQTRLVDNWHRVNLTGAVTVVDNATGEVIGSLEAEVEEATVQGEAEALRRARKSLIEKLGRKLEERLLLQMMGKTE